jgi:hypothetical protein
MCLRECQQTFCYKQTSQAMSKPQIKNTEIKRWQYVCSMTYTGIYPIVHTLESTMGLFQFE